MLIHDENDHVEATQTDILVVDGLISEIAKNIEAPKNVKVIDCQDKIISVCVVDTERVPIH